jgi:hypothetical protein
MRNAPYCYAPVIANAKMTPWRCLQMQQEHPDWEDGKNTNLTIL